VHIVKRVILGARKYVVPPPTQLIVEFTRRCNRKCDPCARTLLNIPPAEISVETFKKLLTPNILRVAVLGLGEPFAHPDIWELIDLCGSRLVSFTTNADMIDFKRLAKYKNVSLVISHYDERQTEALKECRKLGITAYCQHILIPGRHQENGCSNATWLNPIQFHESVKHYDDLDQGNWAEVREKLVGGVIPPLYPTRQRCPDPWFSIRVMANGDIFPCCHSTAVPPGGYREIYHGHQAYFHAERFKLGNIETDDILKLWYGDKYKRHRKFLCDNEVQGKTLTVEQYSDLHKKSCDSSGEFDYCRGCTVRWGKAC
jgi:MoaA/NifB/PqqE/SkfB family radical SAM enzyme